MPECTTFFSGLCSKIVNFHHIDVDLTSKGDRILSGVCWGSQYLSIYTVCRTLLYDVARLYTTLHALESSNFIGILHHSLRFRNYKLNLGPKGVPKSQNISFTFGHNSGWKKPYILASKLYMVTKSAISPKWKLGWNV